MDYVNSFNLDQSRHLDQPFGLSGTLRLGFLGLRTVLLLIGSTLTYLDYLLFYKTSNEILGARGVDLSARGVDLIARGVDMGVLDDIWG